MVLETSDSERLDAGFAGVEITPAEAIRMAGYGLRISEGVRDPLEAKAAAFRGADGKTALLITADLIGFDGAFAESMCDAIADKTGVPASRIALNASHTHGGPILGIRYAANHGETDEGAVARYTDWLRERLAEAASAAVADLSPARLSWAMGAASFMMNRRKPTPEGVRNAPNPRGYSDRAVPVLRAEDERGALRFVAFGCSCHCTTLKGDNLRLTADYAGFARRLAEREAGAPAAFVQGFGASSNPYPRGTYELAQKHGEGLGAEVVRLLREGEWQPVRGPLAVAAGSLELPIEPPPSPQDLEALRANSAYEARVADKIQALLDSQGPWPTRYETRMAVWQFGADMTLAVLPGEVVGEFVPVVEQAIGPLNLWLAGYSNDYFGYLPTRRVQEEGGYEARDFITGWGYLDRGTEDAVATALKALAAQAGRPPAETVPKITLAL